MLPVNDSPAYVLTFPVVGQYRETDKLGLALTRLFPCPGIPVCILCRFVFVLCFLASERRRLFFPVLRSCLSFLCVYITENLYAIFAFRIHEKSDMVFSAHDGSGGVIDCVYPEIPLVLREVKVPDLSFLTGSFAGPLPPVVRFDDQSEEDVVDFVFVS